MCQPSGRQEEQFKVLLSRAASASQARRPSLNRSKDAESSAAPHRGPSDSSARLPSMTSYKQVSTLNLQNKQPEKETVFKGDRRGNCNDRSLGERDTINGSSTLTEMGREARRGRLQTQPPPVRVTSQQAGRVSAHPTPALPLCPPSHKWEEQLHFKSSWRGVAQDSGELGQHSIPELHSPPSSQLRVSGNGS